MNLTPYYIRDDARHVICRHVVADTRDSGRADDAGRILYVSHGRLAK